MLGRKLFSSSLVLGLVLSFVFPAHADLLKNLKTDGSIETRSFGIDNENDRNGAVDDYRSETNYRVMVGATTDLLDDVHARISLTKNALQGSGHGSITSVQGTTFFDNAYFKVDKVFGHVDLTAGRQFYGDSNDLVIYFGPQNDSILSVTSLDAFRADADVMGFAKFHGIAGKIADTGVATTPVPPGPSIANSNSDTNVWGGELNTDKVVPAANLAAYYYTAQTKKQANAILGNNTLVVYGARLNGDIPMVAGLGYMAEIIQDGGRNNGTAALRAYNGTAWDLGVHYGHDLGTTPVRAHLEYGQGSANFVSIAPGRRYGIIWGEFTTTATDLGYSGLSNLKVLSAGGGVTPIAKLGVDLNAYRFRYASTASNKTSAGTEYDLIVSWKHSDNVSFEVNAADFQVGDANQNAAPTGTNPITELGADVKIKF
jgi:hypothetical protein